MNFRNKIDSMNLIYTIKLGIYNNKFDIDIQKIDSYYLNTF